MPRETVVGNGRIAVAFDSKMSIRDFFYPGLAWRTTYQGMS